MTPTISKRRESKGKTIRISSLQSRILLRCAAAFLVLTISFLTAWPQAVPPTPPFTIPALFLSDIHLNPFSDPALLAKLAGNPAVEPSTESSASPTLAATQNYCRTLPDATNALFRSSLAAMKPQAASVRFVTVSGDLISHQFTRCFTALVLKIEPVQSEPDQYPVLTTEQKLRYRDFVQKTVEYVTSRLRETFPQIPIYYALGNNDSACGDYDLDPHGDFLRRTASLVADGIADAGSAHLSAASRAAIFDQFGENGSWQAIGSYNVPLAALPNTRLIVIDDVFLATDHQTCARVDDPTAARAELAWLALQLKNLKPGERVWIMGHIPPGLNLYESAKQRQPVMFLKYDFTYLLAPYANSIRLAIFAHTHIDGLTTISFPRAASPGDKDSVPLKSVQSISPNHGNPPTFTLAKIDPKTSDLVEYTLITATKSASTYDYTWPTLDTPPPTWTTQSNSPDGPR